MFYMKNFLNDYSNFGISFVDKLFSRITVPTGHLTSHKLSLLPVSDFTNIFLGYNFRCVFLLTQNVLFFSYKMTITITNKKNFL